MTTPSLSIRSLHLTIGSRTIYDGLSLDLWPRSITALMGPGGAGKSTLLHWIADRLQGSHIQGQGDLRIASRDPATPPTVSLMRQTPSPMMRPAIEWLLQSHPRRDQFTRLELTDKIEQFLADYDLHHLRTHLQQKPIEWSLNNQRLLFLVACLLADPDILCVDEPCATMDDDQAQPILDVLHRARDTTSVLWVTHHQRRARQLSDHVALLAGGRIVEAAPTERFFDDPQSTPAKDFVRTGSCHLPSPDTPAEHLAPEYQTRPEAVHELSPDDSLPEVPRSRVTHEPDHLPPSEPAALSEPQPVIDGLPLDAPSIDASWHRQETIQHIEPLVFRKSGAAAAHRGPSEFHWIWPGLLAGVAMPGLLRPIEQDLRALQRVGIKALVTLTETPIDSDAVQQLDIAHLHSPIVDMTPPSLEQALQICSWADLQLADDRPLAFHCRAGIGRTGTLLACQIMATLGGDSDAVVQRLRKIMNRYVQSTEQFQFLAEFGATVPPALSTSTAAR